MDGNTMEYLNMYEQKGAKYGFGSAGLRWTHEFSIRTTSIRKPQLPKFADHHCHSWRQNTVLADIGCGIGNSWEAVELFMFSRMILFPKQDVPVQLPHLVNCKVWRVPGHPHRQPRHAQTFER